MITTISSILLKKRGVCSIDSGTICSLSGRSAVEKSMKSTLIRGLTNKSNPDTIKTMFNNLT